MIKNIINKNEKKIVKQMVFIRIHINDGKFQKYKNRQMG